MPEQHQRRDLEKMKKKNRKNERQHPGARIQQHVAAQHRRDRAARPHESARSSPGRRRPAPAPPPGRRAGRRSTKRTRPIESSMLFPKIHRNSMLKMMCSQPPCMNIEVKIVRNQGGWSSCSTGARLPAPPRPGSPASPRRRPLPTRSRRWRPGPRREVALLARVGDPVGDRAVLDHRLRLDLVRRERERRSLEEQEHEHVDHDDHDRDDREVVGRDVVPDRDQESAKPTWPRARAVVLSDSSPRGFLETLEAAGVGCRPLGAACSGETKGAST